MKECKTERQEEEKIRQKRGMGGEGGRITDEEREKGRGKEKRGLTDLTYLLPGAGNEFV